MADDDDLELSEDEKIVSDAKKAMKKGEEWEATCRARYVEDTKFANADSDNGYQWPDNIKNPRDTNGQPCLTINKTMVHCLMIQNEAKQNKPSVKIRPVGNGATVEAAQTFEGIVRHIENISNAENVYDSATTTQVQGGWGYWRVITKYLDDESFDQEIFIDRIKDPLTVYLDPDINEVDGSDAKWGIIFSNVPKDIFYAEHPDLKGQIGQNVLKADGDTWVTADYVRVAEYYRKSRKKDELLSVLDPETGERRSILASKLADKAQLKVLKSDPETKARSVVNDSVMWYKIAGDRIIDRRPWAGKYIPIVRVIGTETIIDGQLDRKGHVRAMKDPQRMYNYWSSGAVGVVALQSKSPYVAAVEAIEGYEKFWENANVDNYAYLPYNAWNEDLKTAIPAPSRQAPPVMGTAFLQGMQTAGNEMMMVTGQFQSQMGENENAKSGIAINARQRQGDRATYHFIDNLGIALKFTGNILIDLIPKVYDTERTIRIIAEDGTKSDVVLDPKAQAAYLKEQAKTAEEAKAIFNPNVGRYEVVSDPGPGFATRRQEAFNAFTQILAQNKEAWPIIGDLMFKAADFPGAEEIAERLRRMVPPEALGEGLPPQAQQQLQTMQQKIQQLMQVLQQTVQELAKKDQELADKTKDQAIREYEAISKRITAASNAIPETSPAAMAPMLAQAEQQSLENPLDDEDQSMQDQQPIDLASLGQGDQGMPPMGQLGTSMGQQPMEMQQ